MGESAQDPSFIYLRPHEVEEIHEIVQFLYRLELESQQQKFEAEDNLEEAAKIKQQIQNLKRELAESKRQALAHKQANQQRDIEAAYVEEVKQFKKVWNQKVKDYKQECRLSKEALLDQQKVNFEIEQEKILTKLPMEPKPSSAYLNLLHRKETCIRTKNYEKAARMQQKIEELKQNEREKYLPMRERKLNYYIRELHKRQKNEQENLELRIKSGLNEIRREMKKELEGIKKRYKNLRQELKLSQALEWNRMKGKHTNSAPLFDPNSSRMIFSYENLTKSRLANILEENKSH